MFVTGVLVGSIIGSAFGLLAAAAILAARQAQETVLAPKPALVPLHVEPGTLVSLN